MSQNLKKGLIRYRYYSVKMKQEKLLNKGILFNFLMLFKSKKINR